MPHRLARALRVGGDVTNRGVWDAEHTELNGAGPQTLTLAGDGLASGFGRLVFDTTPASPLVARQ